MNSVDRKRSTHTIDDSPEAVSPSRQIKKRRIVISSDEEDEGQGKVKKTPARKEDEPMESETPKSTPRHRIILVDSDDDNDYVGICFTNTSYLLF